MQVEHPVCCGIDVHKDMLTACLRRVDANGQVSKEEREFATTYTSLLALSDWLVEQHCPVVAMESTGVYGKPVSHVLAGTVEVFIGNAHEMRSRPGKKTDKREAAWIAELLAHGLIRPSFVPPPAIGALRDVPRTRSPWCKRGAKGRTGCTSSLRIPISHSAAWSPISLG